MKITVDRIEGDLAVCELPDMSFVNIPKIVLGDVKEGDVFEIIKDESVKQEQMQRAQSLFDKLKKK